jgi:hypothetical protein
MNTLRDRSRAADAVALVVSLAVVGVGAAVVGPPVTTPPRGPVRAVASAVATQSWPAPAAVLSTSEVGSVRITMTTGDTVVTATLADTPAAHKFAAMLPLTVDLHDPFGQAKSGALPHPLPVDGTDREFHPRTGEIYYWPDGGDLAVFHDVLGQAVPPPGLIRLGTALPCR